MNLSLSPPSEITARDAADPLRARRDLFDLPEGMLYLDGNSLGPMVKTVPERVHAMLTRQWAPDLITSWNVHQWTRIPFRLGDRIARLIGAEQGSVVVADSTSINLYKAVGAALALVEQQANPRKTIVSDTGNFPTDLYMADGLIRLKDAGYRLHLATPEAVAEAIDADTAIVMLTEVDYRTGRRHDMAALTAKAHAVGALVIWDLAHSAGAFPVDLAGCKVDFAVGCSYKYLNGGPGGPAFLYAAPRHQDKVRSPLSGWLGHEAPFKFDLDYRPATGIERFICGTPNLAGLAVLDAALDAFDGVDLASLRQKSIGLCELFLALAEADLAPLGFTIATPRDATARGSQVSLRHPQGFEIVQALIARKVVGDFRAPDYLRFGFCPLYLRYADVWHLARHIREVVQDREHTRPEFAVRGAVT